MWNISLPDFRTQYVIVEKSNTYNVLCKVENDNKIIVFNL